MIHKFDHLVLFCHDTAASKAWYDGLGFTYLHGYEDMHWYRLGEGQLMLHPSRDDQPVNGPSCYVGVDDVDAYFAQVVAAGYKPIDHQQTEVVLAAPVERPWGHREFELVDPDGHIWGFLTPIG